MTRRPTAPISDSAPGQESFRKRWLLGFIIVALPIGNLGVLGPAGIYLANPRFFAYPLSAALAPMLVISLAIAALLSGGLAVLPRRCLPSMLAVFLALGGATWIQGNFLLWDYGVLQGGDLDWSEGDRHPWIGPTVWIILLTAAICARHWLTHRGRLLAPSILLIQAVALGIGWWRLPPLPSHQRYALDDSRLFEFSSARNVIVLVLDTFQSSAFAQALEQQPDLQHQLAGFTFYQNTTSAFAKTLGSIPSILTGQLNRNEQPLTEFIEQAYRQSVPGELKKVGWRAELYPWVRQTVLFSPDVADNIHPRTKPWVISHQTLFLLDLGLFRQVPHILKRAVFNQNRWLLSGGAGNTAAQGSRYIDLLQFDRRLADATVSSQDRRPRFAFYHLQGPHAPFWLNANLEPAKLPQDGRGYQQQAQACLLLVGHLLARLQGLGIYKDSLIIISGDHGAGEYEVPLPVYSPGTVASFAEPPALVRRGGTPMLLVKFPGLAGPLTVSQKPAALSDIPTTILAALSIESSFPGCPIQELQEGEARERWFYQYGFEGWDQEYLPPMQEWVVNGHSWSAASWKPTGALLAPARMQSLANLASGSAVTIRFGKGRPDNALLDRGWSEPDEGYVWSNDHHSNLHIERPADKGPLLLELELHPFLVPDRLTNQRVRISLDGQAATEWQVKEAGVYQLLISSVHLQSKSIKLALNLPDAVSPQALGLADDSRKLGIALHSLRLSSPWSTVGGEAWMQIKPTSTLWADRHLPRIVQLSLETTLPDNSSRLVPVELLVDGVSQLAPDTPWMESAEVLIPVADRDLPSQVKVSLHPLPSANMDASLVAKVRVFTPAVFALGQTIEMGEPGSSVYCLHGWAAPEKGVEQTDWKSFRWSSERRAVMTMRLNDKSAATQLRFSIQAMPLLAGPITAQRVNVTVNGHPAGSLTISQFGTYHVDFPTALLQDDIAIIALELPDAASPAFDLKLNEDPRRLGLRTETIRLEAAP